MFQNSTDDLNEEQKQLVQMLRSALDSSYVEMIRDTYPSLFDGLVPVQRTVLFLLSDVEELSYYSLLKSMACVFKRLSIRSIGRIIQTMANPDRYLYPLVKFKTDDNGKTFVSMSEIVRSLILSFDPVVPIDNPVVFKVPFLFLVGHVGSDFFIPSYCASDVLTKCMFPDTVIHPDFPTGSYTQHMEQKDGPTYVSNVGRTVSEDGDLYRVESIPFGKTYMQVFEAVADIAPNDLVDQVIEGTDQHFWVSFKKGQNRDFAVHIFRNQFLTTTYPVKYRVFDDGSMQVRDMDVAQIWEMWREYNRLMVPELFDLEQNDSEGIDKVLLDVWQSARRNLRSTFSDRRRTSVWSGLD